MTHIYLHLPVQSIVEEEVVCHADPVRFHRVALAIIVVSHITYNQRSNKKRLRTSQNMNENKSAQISLALL